jgi:hypothetical protein
MNCLVLDNLQCFYGLLIKSSFEVAWPLNFFDL